MSRENIEIIEMEKEEKSSPPEELTNGKERTATDGNAKEKDDSEPQILPTVSRETEQLDNTDVPVIVRERKNSDNNSETKSDVQLLKNRNIDDATTTLGMGTSGAKAERISVNISRNTPNMVSLEGHSSNQGTPRACQCSLG